MLGPAQLETSIDRLKFSQLMFSQVLFCCVFLQPPEGIYAQGRLDVKGHAGYEARAGRGSSVHMLSQSVSFGVWVQEKLGHEPTARDESVTNKVTTKK